MALFDQVKDNLLGLFGGGGEATVAAGAAMLQAGDQGQNWPAALGTGAIVGQQTRQLLEEQALKEQSRQELQQVIASSGMGPDGVRAAFMTAVSNGLMEEAKHLATVYQMMGGSGQAPTKLHFVRDEVIDPETGQATIQTVGYDPYQGREVSRETIGLAPPPPDPYPGGKVDIEDLNSPTGQSQYGIAQDGSQVWLGYTRPSGSGGESSSGINDAMTSVMFEAADVLDQNDELLAEIWQGSLARAGQGDGLGGLLARSLTEEDTQVAFTAALQFLNPTVRFLSGAQMTENEARRYQAALIPLPGDRPSTVARKREARRVMVNAIRAGADIPETKEDALKFLRENGLTMHGEGEDRATDDFVAFSAGQVPMPSEFSGPAPTQYFPPRG